MISNNIQMMGNPAELKNKIEQTTEDLTIYVATTGNDATGDGSIGNPYATITHAYSLVPRVIRHRVRIMIANGVYNDFPDVFNNYSDNSQLTFDCYEGVTVDSGPYTITAITSDFLASATGLEVAGSPWTADSLYGKFIRFIDGPAVGYIQAVHHNELNTLVCQTVQVADTGTLVGSTFEVVSVGVRINVDRSVTVGGHNEGEEYCNRLVFSNMRWVMDYATYDYTWSRKFNVHGSGCNFFACDIELQFALNSYVNLSGEGINTAPLQYPTDVTFLNDLSSPPFDWPGLWHLLTSLQITTDSPPATRQMSLALTGPSMGFWGVDVGNVCTRGGFESVAPIFTSIYCLVESFTLNHQCIGRLTSLYAKPVADYAVRVSQQSRLTLSNVWVGSSINNAIYLHRMSSLYINGALGGEAVNYVFRLGARSEVLLTEALSYNGTIADIYFARQALGASYPPSGDSVTDGESIVMAD